ncbi:MAG: hypothetical protein PVH77_12380 [Phycisphaerales bacterium]
MKSNCWEFMNCGRQPEGDKAEELGACLASTNEKHDGKNNGKNAGRYCWKIAGTMCGGRVQGSFASKVIDCVRCKFFQQVKQEEGDNFKT